MDLFDKSNKNKIKKIEGISCLCVEEYPLEEKTAAEIHRREAARAGFIAHCLYDPKLRNYGVWVSEYQRGVYFGRVRKFIPSEK